MVVVEFRRDSLFLCLRKEEKHEKKSDKVFLMRILISRSNRLSLFIYSAIWRSMKEVKRDFSEIERTLGISAEVLVSAKKKPNVLNNDTEWNCSATCETRCFLDLLLKKIFILSANGCKIILTFVSFLMDRHSNWYFFFCYYCWNFIR